MGWNLKSTGTPASGKSTGSGKRKNSVANINNIDDDEVTTPTKKTKTPAKNKIAVSKKGKKSSAIAKDDSEDEVAKVEEDAKPVKNEAVEEEDV